MINDKLLNPKSVAVIGGSDDIYKPGGKVLKNLIDNNFTGDLYVVNPKLDSVQGIKSFRSVEDLPQVDCAILAIAAKYCYEAVENLVTTKETGGFIILSAGFSEENEEGAKLEKKIVDLLNKNNASLIGPNCVGLLNQTYSGIFTTPIPKLDSQGVDFISGSGATAVFIMEAAVPKGLKFSSVYSVGNSAQLGVEDILKFLDETYVHGKSAPVKLLYIESVDKAQMLYKHASSLIRKGAKIAAIKSGGSEAGSRAASSHTGALASPDLAVEALFRKAGIVRCNGREELASVASIFMHPIPKGKNIAIITHAGGPAVMLTDSLSNGGLNIPAIEGEKAQNLLTKLFAGSSVANPIDFLATGTAEQLGHIIDACNNDFDEIDAMAVIFGSPGLFPVYDVYDLLHEKMKTSKKPIYPILPSVINVKDEIEKFIEKGRINFPDEVAFGNALSKIMNTPEPQAENIDLPKIDTELIRKVIDSAENGYLNPDKVFALLDAAGIDRAFEQVVYKIEDAIAFAEKHGFPLVMKVVGPVHKSDVGGVVLNVKDKETITREFERLMKIKDTYAVLMGEMLKGTEIFIGAKREENFGHMILAGLGGIFIEVLHDVNTCISPVSKNEAEFMIKNLKSYKIIEGIRGQEGVNQEIFAEQIQRVSALMEAAPEIFEMDLNPLLGNTKYIKAVDARIRIEK
ncbi:MAG: acetate--CoA ligase family protein [Bacteroidales bacterium]|jgi:acetyltransferase|nr:acetate--CoA ligase family protein [Bacteroidales bacterium]NLB86466.1 acetate--CoA ligase family protein [Bacteroidales bacterium]